MKAMRCNLACPHREFLEIDGSITISIEFVKQFLHSVLAHCFSHLVKQLAQHFDRHLNFVAMDSMRKLPPEHFDDVAEALLVLF